MTQKRILIGGMIILVTILAMSFLVMPQYMVYFYLPKEAQAQAQDLKNKTIKIGGMVEPGSIQWTPENLKLQFLLGDKETAKISVEYHGAPPDMFKENAGAVVEGRITEDGKNFQAHKLMVKHSEEYKAVGEQGHSLDKQLLEKSLFQ